MRAKLLDRQPPTILVPDYNVLISREFIEILQCEGVKPYPLPIKATLMNAYIE